MTARVKNPRQWSETFRSRISSQRLRGSFPCLTQPRNGAHAPGTWIPILAAAMCSLTSQTNTLVFLISKCSHLRDCRHSCVQDSCVDPPLSLENDAPEVQSSLQVLFWSLGLLAVIQCIAGGGFKDALIAVSLNCSSHFSVLGQWENGENLFDIQSAQHHSSRSCLTVEHRCQWSNLQLAHSLKLLELVQTESYVTCFAHFQHVLNMPQYAGIHSPSQILARHGHWSNATTLHARQHDWRLLAVLKLLKILAKPYCTSNLGNRKNRIKGRFSKRRSFGYLKKNRACHAHYWIS